jgi:hypothetical protein
LGHMLRFKMPRFLGEGSPNTPPVTRLQG